MQVEPWVSSQPRLDGRCLVGAVVVADQADLKVPGNLFVDLDPARNRRPRWSSSRTSARARNERQSSEPTAHAAPEVLTLWAVTRGENNSVGLTYLARRPAGAGITQRLRRSGKCGALTGP
ncbi:hypothetical protein GCM10009730_61800 [Streptomyces albidochromogenes]